MSDGKEVKRFYFVPTGEKDVFGSPTFVCHDKSLNGDDWFMPVEDHDRIVAELRAEVERLKGKTPTRIRFDGTRFKKVKDRFERAFSQLNRPNDTDEQFLISSVESLLLDVGELEARVLHDITYRDETIARQARVIEKLKLQRGTILHEKYAGFPMLAMNAESDLDKELAAIEQQGEGT